MGASKGSRFLTHLRNMEHLEMRFFYSSSCWDSWYSLLDSIDDAVL